MESMRIIFIFRIYLGKNSITQLALGKTPEDEYKDNLRHISKVSIFLVLVIGFTAIK